METSWLALAIGVLAAGSFIGAQGPRPAADDPIPLWGPADGPRRDDVDSPFVPDGYVRRFTANFDNESEVFNRSDNPQFTTSYFRLNPDDLNTCRRLATTGERQIFTDKDFTYNGAAFNIDPFSVKDGVLTITAMPLSDEQKAALKPLEDETRNLKSVLYSSGMLSTETQLRKPGQGYHQLYGYWELRARLPKGRGLWPAFWLVAETHDYWDEVDVFEVHGQQPDRIFQTTHFHDGGGTDGMDWPAHTVTGIDASDGFHVFGLLVHEDGRLQFMIDGRTTLEVRHALEVPLYTMVCLTVGGNWSGDPDETTPFPAGMDIDYLRIYRAPEKGTPANPTE
jgi:beta-glucanase (GH16 family)